MPLERSYESQVMPGNAAAPALASPAAFGAGIGAALDDAGGTVHRAQLRTYEVEKQLQGDQEAADFAHKFALHRQNMDGIVAETRTNAAPGGAGHVQQVMEANDAGRDTLFAGITDPRLQRQASQQWDDYSTRLHDGATTFATVSTANKVVTDFKSLSDVGANRILQGHDPAAYVEEVKQAYAAIDGLRGITDDQKAALRREQVDQKYGAAFVTGMIHSNPEGAKTLLDKGAFNDQLEPHQIEQLRNSADVEIRRSAAETARVAAAGKSLLNEKIATATEKASQGIDVSAELPELMQGAAAIGDTSNVEKLKGLQRDSAFAKVFNGQTPVQRQAQLAQLTAIAPEKRSEDQQAELKWLQTKSGALDGEFNRDPVGFVTTHGQPGEQPPPLNPADLGTFQQRAQWRRGMVGAYGRMDLLSANERAGMIDRLGQGDAGYSEVTDTLAKFGGADARQAAREVAPNDHYLQQLVLLPQDYRKIARDGQQALKENPKLLPQENGTDIDQAVVSRTTGFERALAAVPQADRNAVHTVARNIAAKFLHDHPGELDGDLWSMSLNLALGATGVGKDRRGGLSLWNDQAFLVPDGMTGQQFTNRVFGYLRANPGNGPVNPDGSPANLRNARPVAMGGGTYQFRIGDRAVMARGRDGKITSPWQFMLRGGQ